MDACVHSCKGLCRALALAEQNVREGLEVYRHYHEGCDYPDVKVLLAQLVQEHERMLRLLEEKREILNTKFTMLDDVRESFL